MIAVTPIKLNSERVPHKNIKVLCEKPLLQWSIEVYQEIAPVYVYCDREAKSYLPKGVHWINEGETPDQDGNSLFFNMISSVPETDWVLVFDVTSPFVKRETVQNAVDAVMNGDYDSAVSMIEMRGRLWGKNYINHDPATCPRTQTQDPIYKESEGFWIFQKRLMLEERRRVGHRPYFAVVDGAEAIDVDTPQDWQFAELVGGAL